MEYYTKTCIGRYHKGVVKVYQENTEIEHFFPLHPDIKNETESIYEFGQCFDVTMEYNLDHSGKFIGRPFKYSIPLLKFKRIK